MSFASTQQEALSPNAGQLRGAPTYEGIRSSAMSRPFISFLTSAYRTERYIGETIDSVLAQTRADWELIVVDNGNSEEMARVVGNYTRDSRIKLVRQENKLVRGGVTAAADVAVGRYLCVLNSDDMLQPNFCERVGTLVDAAPGIDAVGCDADRFPDPDDGTPPEGYFETLGRRSVPDPSRAVSLTEFLDEGVPLYIGVFRREVWDALGGYDPAISDVEPDVELWLRLAAAGHDVRVLPHRLARIRVRPDSLSHDPSSIEEYEDALERAFMAVCEHSPVSEATVSAAPMMRRVRYARALRRARWALLGGDVPGARAAARDAYHQQRTLRAAVVIAALRVSPRMSRSIHPAKNRAQDAVRRARYRITRARMRRLNLRPS